MRKIFGVAVFLLLLVGGVWGGATYWFGMQTEKQYRTFLQQASSEQIVKVTNESYDRGFLRSKAQSVIELQTPPGVTGDIQPPRITLVHDITHGPFPFAASPDGKLGFKPVMGIIETRLVLSPETQKELSDLYAQVPEISAVRDYTIIYLDGHGEENFIIPPFERTLGKEEDQTTVDWKGLSLQVRFTADFDGFKGTLSIPGLHAIGKKDDLKLEGIKVSFDVQKDVSGLTLGEASFALAGLQFKESQETNPTAFMIQGFSISTSNKAADGNLNCSLAVLVDQLKVGEMPFGPGVFEIEFRNLDAASVAKMQEAARDLQIQSTQQSPAAMQMMMLSRYLEILPGMLKKSPEVEISRLDLKTADGDFTGKAKVSFDGTKPEFAANPLMFAQAVTAQAEFTAAERLSRRAVSQILKSEIAAESKTEEGDTADAGDIDALVSQRTDEQLNELVAQGILVRENGNFKCTASYRAGEVVLNGRTLPLDDLFH